MRDDSNNLILRYESPIAGITGIEDIITTGIVIVLECMINEGVTGNRLACFQFQ